MKRLSFIGAGNMATAIIKGVASGKLASAYQISACDLDGEKVKALEAFGVINGGSVAAMSAASDLIVLAVKPQNMGDILPELKQHMNRNAVVISIAAGISAAFLKEALGFDAKVIPVMPNTPLLIGCGATAMAQVAPVTSEEFQQVVEIFTSAGKVEVIEQRQLIDIIPVNGSSPAYIYRFAKAFVDYAEEKGIDGRTALTLFCQSLIGSAKMMLESGKSIDELIAMVSSKGGTTLKGSEVLIERGFEEIVKESCEACAKRGYELAK